MTYSPVVVAKGSIPAGSDANKLFNIMSAPPDRCMNIIAFNFRGGDATEQLSAYICPPDTRDNTTVNNGSGHYVVALGCKGASHDQTYPGCLFANIGFSQPMFIVPPGWKLMVAASATNTLAWYASAVGIVE